MNLRLLVMVALLVGGGAYLWVNRSRPIEGPEPPPGPLPAPEVAAKQLELLPPDAGDWPQWRGPNRDGAAGSTGLLPQWPAGGPPLAWSFDKAGEGYSAPAVVGGKLFLAGARGGAEFVSALDAATGAPFGEFAVGPPYVNDYGGGPRGTPAVDGDRVYALGGWGDYVCYDVRAGQELWRKNIYKEFGGQRPTWGCGESPTVAGDVVLATPGGAGGMLVALNKLTGELVWRSKGWANEELAYSSPVPATLGGVPQVIQMTARSVAGVRLSDGVLLWRFPFPDAVVRVPTPLVRGDRLFVTSGYQVGSQLLQVSGGPEKFEVSAIYATKKFSNHHGGVVEVGGNLYGTSGNTNSRNSWACVELATGKVRWEEEAELEAGSILAADGRLYLYGQKAGTAVLLEPSAEGWSEKGRFAIPQTTALPRKQGGVWTHPVVAGGRLYLRDQERLYCYDVRGAGR